MKASFPSKEVPEIPWAGSLFNALKIGPDATLADILKRTDDAATRLAPDTRRLWRWILVLEGAAVLLPTFWLLVLPQGWTPVYTAYAVLVCTFAVVGACWWMRWRGMQRTWTHARLVAEVARSLNATAGLPERVTYHALVSAPALQTLVESLPGAANQEATLGLEEAKKSYSEDRILDQLKYYVREGAKALKMRKRLSGYVTWSLDGALFLAVAGVVLVFVDKGWHILGISGSAYVLGLMGMALPLVAILMQSLSSYFELNRRNARYAQQIEYLKAADVRLKAALSMEDVVAVALEVETSLLAEVVEWFYQAEHAEMFYRPQTKASPFVSSGQGKSHPGWVGRLLGGLWSGMSYVAFVIFGRLIVAALAVVITTALISYRASYEYIANSKLSVGDGQLLSSASSLGWNPKPERTANGFILIAHGLHDKAILPTHDGQPDKAGSKIPSLKSALATLSPQEEEQLNWMKQMQDKLETKLKDKLPDICLVDWHETAAKPSASNDMISDVAAIRARAALIGQMVGYKLAAAINEKKISRDQPMHFIGHSAGGFVILSAARVLVNLNLAPSNLRLTILDTPMPDVSDSGDFVNDLKLFPIDYYCSSLFAKGVPSNGTDPHYTRIEIQPDPKLHIDEFTGAHSYSHDWYIGTIDDGDVRGFARSPFKALQLH